MNINDLPKGSYKEVPLNINNLPQGSYSPVNQSAPEQSLSQKIWSSVASAPKKITNALGLQGVVDTVSTDLAPLALATDPSIKNKLTAQNYLPQPSLKQNIGSGIQLGALTGGATVAPVGMGSAIAAGALTGAGQAGGASLSQNESLGTAVKKAGIGAAVGGVVAGAVAGTGRFLERLGDKIQYSVIKPTKPDIDDGFSLDTIKKYDLGGSLSSVFKKTESTMDDLTVQLNDKLNASTNTINLSDVLKKTTERLQKDNLSGFGSNTSISNAIEQLQKEVLNVGTDLTIPEAQIVKRASGHFGAWQYGMFDPDSTARQKVYNVFYNELKKAIEDGSPEGVQAINKQLSELIPVMNAVIRRIPIAERNNALSLTDIIGLVGSAIDPRALGVTMINLLSKSGAVADAMMKAGPAITAGAPGAATIATAPLPNVLESEPKK